MFVNQDQDIVHIPNIMVDAPAQKFTGKNLSWRIIELELGENLVFIRKLHNKKHIAEDIFTLHINRKRKYMFYTCSIKSSL